MSASSTKTEQGWRFVLRPNCSLSWRQTQLFYAAICCTTLVVAGSFAMVGFWPVLPFAGLELALLGACLWSVARRGQTREVIEVARDRVLVEKGRERPQEVFECPRAWARAVLLPARVRSHPSQLVVRSHGRHVTVGQFLCEHERADLAHRLQNALRGAFGDAR